MIKDFFLAKEAHEESSKNIKLKEEEFIETIVREGIMPAINLGKFSCEISFDEEVPVSVFEKFTIRGYIIDYKKVCLNQFDGYTVDKKQIIVKW